jgi:hypothetical protein
MTRRNRDILILACIGIALVILVSIQGAKHIDLAPVFILVLYAGLIAVTMFYVYYSMEIARATREQAEASVEMAEEMRGQRYSESLPLLVPDITRRDVVDRRLEPNEVDYGTLQTGVGLEVIWHNLGKGVAINARFSLWSVPLDSHPDKVIYFPPRESTFLEIGGRHKIEFKEEWKGQWFDQPESYKPRLEAEYRDIYERNITTAQEFRIDKQNKKVFLGDLYFTVNGKRLGEEATRQ